MSTEEALKMLQAYADTENYFIPINYDAEDIETSEEWGHSCYSRERFFSMFYDDFNVVAYFPGLNQGNQDLAVFIKTK